MKVNNSKILSIENRITKIEYKKLEKLHKYECIKFPKL